MTIFSATLSPRKLTVSFRCFLLFFAPLLVSAQQSNLVPDKKTVKIVTDSLAAQLKRYYVDETAAVQMGAAIRKNYRDGKYRQVRDVHVLAGKLTEDLRLVHRDEHLHVEYNPEIAYELSGQVEDVPAMVARKHERERQLNFGLKKAEVLSGNIAYLELSHFSRLNRYSKATADAALQMLSNADAMIIDLRYGAGGSPEMMTHLLSHFYSEKIHVSDIYIRSEDAKLSYHTTPDAAYGRLTEIPLYILTSYKTFSAAEAFVYTLQKTGRAKIIGENTRGGAHTVTYRPLGAGFICDVPFGKAMDPVTGENWEKTGIQPDLATSAELALEAAELLIFDEAISNAADSTQKNRMRLQRELLLSKNHPFRLDSTALLAMSGNYGPYCVTYENGCLYYQKSGKARFPLIPMSETSMRVKGTDDFVLRFQKNAQGSVEKIATCYGDGRIEMAVRSAGLSPAD